MTKTKILGLSGKKSSGKTTAANWIIGQQMCSVDMVSWAKINDKGQLVVPAVVNDELTEGVFDPLSQNPAAQNLLSQYVWPVVKLYSFADILKLSAMAIFGLTHEQVNGTNEEKNAPTKFTWKQFLPFLSESTIKQLKQDGIGVDLISDETWSVPMSGRHILQVVGTDIFRTIHGDVWVDACIKNVLDDGAELAIITDCRFPNEVEGVQAAGGKVLRYARAPFGEADQHTSETALDGYDNFDHVMDNSNMSIPEQNKATNELLDEWGYTTWEWKEAKAGADASKKELTVKGNKV